ncbi:hypothetical protein ACWX0P_27810 [Vibrio mediterranei]
MTGRIKWLVFVLIVALAYGVAWLKTYNLSSNYFTYAEQQYQQSHYIEALKGKNKLEMRRDDMYLGGYQQVVEAWEGTMFGPKPSFYYQAKLRVEQSLTQLGSDGLLQLIETYVELDSRYIPEAAERLKNKAYAEGDLTLYKEMGEFLHEAFPDFKREEVTQ